MRLTGSLRRAPGTSVRAGVARRLRRGRNRYRPPGEVLGAQHPLAQIADALACIGRHSLVAVALLLGSSADVIQGVSWATPVALASAFVLVCLAITASAFVRRRRDCAVELIVEGRESLPIAAVQRERQRLAAPRTRRVLGRTRDGMLRDAANFSFLRAWCAAAIPAPTCRIRG